MTSSLAAASITGLLLAATVAAAPTSLAAPSVDPKFEKMQVGVTYTVYAPQRTLGMALKGTIGANWCSAGSESEQNINAEYTGKGTSGFSVSEANPFCFDFALGATVGTTTVLGQKATIEAYCDPASSAPCTKSDVRKYGGQLAVTLPAGAGLRNTQIVIESIGKNPLSYQQLITVAKSLTPVG
ncbi:MAG: hypothetical protein HQ453_14015 [Actinobacteria bacterium]|nr:hypothetical protein [Actinomycetota bacterium]